HGLMPLYSEDDNNPLKNSANVKTSPFVTWLHNNVAYHIEHHLFPALNYKFAPKVSAMLTARCGEHYRAEPVFQAWVKLFQSDLYKTPVGAADGTGAAEAQGVEAARE